MRVSPFDFEAPAPSGPPPGRDGPEPGDGVARQAPSSDAGEDRERQAESLEEPGYGHGV